MIAEVVYDVKLIEYERGYGRRIVTTETFDTEELAIAYADKINSKNTSSVVPDCYIQASDPVLRIING